MLTIGTTIFEVKFLSITILVSEYDYFVVFFQSPINLGCLYIPPLIVVGFVEALNWLDYRREKRHVLEDIAIELFLSKIYSASL
jgi:hypothetical protein